MQTSTMQSIEEGLGRKKTMFVMVTVVGCIAILCPMLFGSSSPPKQTEIKPGGTGKCCEVILDKESFMNASAIQIGPMYRKTINLYTGEISLRQERPPHLRPENLHPAMRERGRAIPTTQTVPIVDRPGTVKSSPPRIVEGRPGPIPGMRPPMGAGSLHQAQPKASSMGFIMPLYTIGIVAFFVYTIVKVLFKKQVPNAPYGPVEPDPKFRKEVFGDDSYIKKPDESNNPKIVSAHLITSANNKKNGFHQNDMKRNRSQSNDREQLMEIEKLRIKLEETEKAMAKLIGDMNRDRIEAKMLVMKFLQQQSKKVVTAIQGLIDAADEQLKRRENATNLSKETTENSTSKVPENGNISNGHTNNNANDDSSKPVDLYNNRVENLNDESSDFIKHEKHQSRNKGSQETKKNDGSVERSVTVLGMELTASCEGGQKWSRPSTPVFFSHHQHSSYNDVPHSEPQSIFLEGSLPPESQILVADSETRSEKVIDSELNGTEEEPAVVLSSKMTLSLINLSSADEESDDEQLNSNGSPLDEDMEIIENDIHEKESQDD